MTRVLLILPLQKTATPTKLKILRKFQMRNVYIIIQLNCYWYTPWKTGALRRSRLLLLALDLSKLSNSICGSDSSVQHADPSLREKVSLREQKLTHKILHTCYCPLHFLMVYCNPIQRCSKDGMQLGRTLHH